MGFSYLSEDAHLEIRKLTATHLESPEEAEDTHDLELWDEDDLAGKGIADLRISLAWVRQAVYLWQEWFLGGSWKGGTEIYKTWTPAQGAQRPRFPTRNRVIGSYSSVAWGSVRSPWVLADNLVFVEFGAWFICSGPGIAVT